MTKKLPFSLLLSCLYFGRVATLLPKGAFSDVKKAKISGPNVLFDNLFPIKFSRFTTKHGCTAVIANSKEYENVVRGSVIFILAKYLQKYS